MRFPYPIAQSTNSIAQMIKLYLYLHFAHSHLGYRKIKSPSAAQFFMALAIGRPLILHTGMVLNWQAHMTKCQITDVMVELRCIISIPAGILQ